jgi:hypothetical protein
VSWYRVADIANYKEMEIFYAFMGLAVLGSAGAVDAALLLVDRRRGSRSLLSPASIQYFSEKILAKWGAVVCERPPRDRVTVFSGQADALEALYPN